VTEGGRCCYWEQRLDWMMSLLVWVFRGPPFTHPPEPVDNDTRLDSDIWILRISILSPPTETSDPVTTTPVRRHLSPNTHDAHSRLCEKSHLPQTTRRQPHTHRHRRSTSCLRQKPPAPAHRRPARAPWLPCFNHHNPIVAMCAPLVQTTLASTPPRKTRTTRNQTAIQERTGVRPRRL
jgi:hypothetical protein